jgi:hypothetical protein
MNRRAAHDFCLPQRALYVFGIHAPRRLAVLVQPHHDRAAVAVGERHERLGHSIHVEIGQIFNQLAGASLQDRRRNHVRISLNWRARAIKDSASATMTAASS